MIHATRKLGDSTSVAQRFGSTNGITRPEKVLDVLCNNTSGGLLYMQVHEVTNSLIPKGTTYSGGGGYTLTGLTAGHTYRFLFGVNDTQITNGAQTITNGNPNTTPGDVGAGTFVAAGTTVALAGTGNALITVSVVDQTAPQSTPVPAEGAVADFSWPVAGGPAGSGGTLGDWVDLEGVYCCWSSTAATKTIAAASGSIVILVKG